MGGLLLFALANEKGRYWAMAWCPKCKNEYREGIMVCAECGCELVDERGAGMKKPLITGDEDQLVILKKFLEYNHIKNVEILYDNQQENYMLFVKEEDLFQAQKITRVYLEQRAMEHMQKMQEVQEEANYEPSEAAEQINKQIVESMKPREPLGPYVNNAERAEENRSSATALFLIGSLGLIVMILGIVGVLPFKFSNPYLFYGIMCAVFILFIVMGAVSMKNAKLFAKKAESDNSLRDTLIKWCEDNLTAQSVDAHIAEAASTSEEELYFKRYEVLKAILNHQFMNLDQSFLEKLIDDKVYDMVFSE